jgi:hypothetical protein
VSVSPIYILEKRARRVIPPGYHHVDPEPRPRTPRPKFRPEAPLDSTRAFLEWLWSWRACAICETFGACCHREPEVDLARGESWARQLEESRARRAVQ